MKTVLTSLNAPVKVNPDPHPPNPGYRWGLVLIACKKRQMPNHARQEIAENAPPLGQLKMFLMSLQLNNSQDGRVKFYVKF